MHFSGLVRTYGCNNDLFGLWDQKYAIIVIIFIEEFTIKIIWHFYKHIGYKFYRKQMTPDALFDVK